MRAHAVASTVFLSVLLAGPRAWAQSGPPAWPRVPHPPSVAAGDPLAYVRLFDVARVEDRVLVAYTEAGDPRARGALRLAHFRVTPARGAASPALLTREGDDRTLAPAASAVALTFDGTRGALAYVVPRPHRGERPGDRRRAGGPDGADRALAEPLGSSALTAGDVTLVRLDARGEPLGRAVTVFEDNAQTSLVSVATAGAAGFLVAWTGAVSVDGELRGTVRWSTVDAQGQPREFASDVSFTGAPGALLRVWAPEPREGADPFADATLVWSGQHCGGPRDEALAETNGTAATHEIETVRDGDTRLLRPLPQRAPRARPGPSIECGTVRVFWAQTRTLGATSPTHVGPVLSADAADAAEGTLFAPMQHGPSRALVELMLAPRRDGAGDAVAPHRARVEAAPSTDGASDEPAAVRAVLRAPRALRVSVGSSGGSPRLLAALSARGDRIALAQVRAAVDHEGLADTLGWFALGQTAHELALAQAPDARPLLLLRTADAHDGPLRVYAIGDGLTPSGLAHAPVGRDEAPDERLRMLVLRAREARAAYTALEASWGLAMERPDPANPPSAGLVAQVRRTRARWESACDPLLAYARQRARQSGDATVNELAREQCEYPPDPANPGPVRPQP